MNNNPCAGTLQDKTLPVEQFKRGAAALPMLQMTHWWKPWV